MGEKNDRYLEEAIQTFIDHITFEKRYSVHTIRSYRDDLEAFAGYLRDDFGGVALQAITPAVVRSWLASMKDAGLSSKSINRKISSLRSFYKFQLRCGVVVQSPMGAIIAPKAAKRLPVFVEQGDMGVLFGEVAFPKDWEGPLDKRRIIFVTPAHADNGTHIYDRRMPMALLAYANIAKR